MAERLGYDKVKETSDLFNLEDINLSLNNLKKEVSNKTPKLKTLSEGEPEGEPILSMKNIETYILKIIENSKWYTSYNEDEKKAAIKKIIKDGNLEKKLKNFKEGKVGANIIKKILSVRKKKSLDDLFKKDYEELEGKLKLQLIGKMNTYIKTSFIDALKERQQTLMDFFEVNSKKELVQKLANIKGDIQKTIDKQKKQFIENKFQPNVINVWYNSVKGKLYLNWNDVEEISSYFGYKGAITNISMNKIEKYFAIIKNGLRNISVIQEESKKELSKFITDRRISGYLLRRYILKHYTYKNLIENIILPKNIQSVNFFNKHASRTEKRTETTIQRVNTLTENKGFMEFRKTFLKSLKNLEKEYQKAYKKRHKGISLSIYKKKIEWIQQKRDVINGLFNGKTLKELNKISQKEKGGFERSVYVRFINQEINLLEKIESDPAFFTNLKQEINKTKESEFYKIEAILEKSGTLSTDEIMHKISLLKKKSVEITKN